MPRNAPAVAGFIAAHRSAISEILQGKNLPAGLPTPHFRTDEGRGTIPVDVATEMLLELANDFYRRLHPGEELDEQAILGALSAALQSDLGIPSEERGIEALESLSNPPPTDKPQEGWGGSWEHLIEGCQILDRSWRYVYLNSAAVKHARRPAEELLGKTMMEAFPGIETTPMFVRLRSAMEEQTVARFVNEFAYPDGDRGVFELVVQPVPEGIFIFSLDITRQTVQRADAEKSENRSHSLIDNMLSGYTYCRMLYEGGVPCDFEYLGVNREFTRLTGLKDVVGKRISEVIPGIRETNPELFEIYGRVVATGQPERFEIGVDYLDGWFDIVVYRPEPGHFVAMFENVTQKKRAEFRLRESEARFRAVVEQAADAFFLHDLEGRFVDVNRAACESLGYSREELLQMTAFDVVSRMTRERAEELWEKARSAAGFTIEGFHRRKDGSVFPVEARLGEIEFGGKKLVLALIRDITERRQSQAAIQYERDRLRLTASAAPGVIHTFCVRPNGHAYFQYASPKIWEIYGVSAEVLLETAEPVLKAIHPDDLMKVVKTTEDAMKSMTEWQCEYRVNHPTKGLIWVEGRSSPTKERDGTVLWHGFLTDITERKQLEQQFLQAQKMEAVGQLAGGIAHDFNNLLTVINGYSDLLLADQDVPGRHQVTIGTIREAGERAAQLTRQLLAFSRKAIVSLRPVDLNGIVTSSKALFERLIGEHIQVTLELAPQLRQIQADPGQLEQVLMNLVVNARDAMPEGGSLSLRTRNVLISEKDAEELQGIKAGEYVELIVNDSGCGMTPEVKEHLFDPFFTTKEIGKGTGLGLSVVHGIIHQLGGEIRVESEPERGTTFRILVPAIV